MLHSGFRILLQTIHYHSYSEKFQIRAQRLCLFEINLSTSRLYFKITCPLQLLIWNNIHFESYLEKMIQLHILNRNFPRYYVSLWSPLLRRTRKAKLARVLVGFRFSLVMFSLAREQEQDKLGHVLHASSQQASKAR